MDILYDRNYVQEQLINYTTEHNTTIEELINLLPDATKQELRKESKAIKAWYALRCLDPTIPNLITIYHGNHDKDMIPKFNYGKKNNDYGVGFYTTLDIELGKEWAYSNYEPGDGHYLHTFKNIDISDLNILDLNNRDLKVSIAILMQNRLLNGKHTPTGKLLDDCVKFISKYVIDYTNYDIIVGDRADDAFFSYINLFIENRLNLYQVNQALQLGNLGKQVFFKSKKAFNALNAVEHSVEIVPEIYNKKFNNRDSLARRRLNDIIANGGSDEYFSELI